MGSGLILLVIVGACLAVLVPKALRSYEARALGTSDKLQDAVRVLSRRPRAPVAEPEPDEASPGLTAAARRRRALLVLGALAVLTLAGAVVGPRWLLAPHLLLDVALIAMLTATRMHAVRAADREWREALGRDADLRRARVPSADERATRAAARAAERAERARQAFAAEHADAARRLVAPAHVAGIPNRMPSRSALLPEVAAVALSLAPPPVVRGAKGEPWSPNPVPLPTYVTAPQAPRTRFELGRAAPADLASAERELGIVDQGPELDEILDGRRAVND